MALFKISKGNSANLPAEMHDGYCYFTIDDGKFYIDYLDINDNNTLKRRPIAGVSVEYIEGTQTASTNAWTGVTRDNALYKGKIIAYKLPYKGTSSAATLNLTLSNGTTSGAKAIKRQGASSTTTHYPAGTVIFMAYDGTYWQVNADYDSNTNTFVTQSASTSADWRKVLLHYTVNAEGGAVPAEVTNKVYAAEGIEVQPSTGTLKATKFKGPLEGNADTATAFSSNANVTLTGDVSGSANSTKGWDVTTTLATTGVTAGSYGPSANATPAYGATFNVPYITVDAKGRITAASTKTVKIPASDNTTYTFAEGSVDGAFSVTPSGGSAQSVPIHGLGSAAYTEASTYAKRANSVYYVLGSSSGSAGDWTGTIDSEVTELYDGLTIIFCPQKAGVSNSTNRTLTNDDSSTVSLRHTCLKILGVWKPVYYQQYNASNQTDNRLTTHYGANAMITMTYRTAANGGTGGWVAGADYNSDQPNYRQLDIYFRPYASTDPIYRYKICALDKDNRLVPLTITNQTNGTNIDKTQTALSFKPDQFWLYNSTTTTAASAVVPAQVLYRMFGDWASPQYTFNTTIPAYTLTYLKGSFDSSTNLFTLDQTSHTSWQINVPTNTANLTLSNYFTTDSYYILMGGSYSSNNYFCFFENNPMYYFDGTTLISVVCTAERAKKDSAGNDIIDTYLTKAAGVTNVAWDNTNKKLTKTINGTTADVVAVTVNNPTLSWNTESVIAKIGTVDVKVKLPANPNTNTTYTLSGAYGSNDTAWVNTLTPSSGSATTSTVPSMVGASSSAAGKAGLVTKPAAGDQDKFLRGDGTWQTVTVTDTLVTQTNIASTTNKDYRLILSNDANDTTETKGVNKNTNLRYNPSTNLLSTGNLSLTGTLAVTGAATFSDNATVNGSLTAGSLLVNGNSSFVNDVSFTKIPTAPTAAAGTNNTQLATTAFVMNAFTANDAMVFKGVVNSAAGLPATHSQGWTYKVGTAGSYVGTYCEVGDLIICVTDGTSANNAHWAVIQNNVDGAVFMGHGGSAIGGATQPVYVKANGEVTAGTALKALAYKDSISYTPAGTIANTSITPAGTISSTSITPAGTNAKSAVTIKATTTDVYSMTSAGSVTAGTAASLTMTVDENEVLSFSWTANTPTAVTLPGRSSAIKAWTGYTTGVDNTYAAAQVFTGTAASHNHTFTGTAASHNHTFTGTAATLS